MLSYIPGTLFVSFVLPGVLAGGLQTIIGGAATMAAMVATRSLTVSIIVGVGAAWLVWGKIH
jgi:branched-subunit amino acid transport protein